MENAVLLEKNEFSKTYRQGEVMIYVAKSYDDRTDLHYIVVSIPQIPHLGVLKLQLPIEFKFEPMRDAFFDRFDCDVFMKELEQKIISNRENLENQHGEN
jgi:hypothetical protein